MGLVDYSDSESDSETQPQHPQPTKQAPPSSSKSSSKPFQKFVSRSNPGKIVVSLPTASGTDAPGRQPDDEPPAKRAKTGGGGGGGGGRFSNFGSFLPPPKATAKPVSSQAAGGKVAPRPGVHLKTGAERAFSRESVAEEAYENGETGSGSGSGLNLPPPNQGHAKAGPSIHPDQKPAEEVKLVGKPLMFKPLSVARKPAKKKNKGLGGGGPSAAKATPVADKSPAVTEVEVVQEGPKKKISLFSIADDSPAAEPLPTPTSKGAYEPLFPTSTGDDGAGASSYDDSYPSYAQLPPATDTMATAHQPHQPQSLSAMADDLNLSAAARRELFGRDGIPDSGPAAASTGAAKVISFDMGREYAHNEAVRASGETIVHNPVRAIAPGKHSLRQLVNSVQNNRSALEDSFAAAKGNKREAAGRYGW